MTTATDTDALKIEEAPVSEATPGVSDQTAAANRQVKGYTLGAMAVGLIPLPLVDVAALSALQLKMLHALAGVYGVEFRKDLGKSAISSLLGGAMSVGAGMPIAASLGKFIPFVGQAVSMVTMPVISGAITYAVGQVFIQHFASGGTFLSFDPDAVRDYFAKQIEEGKKIVENLKQDKKAA